MDTNRNLNDVKATTLRAFIDTLNRAVFERQSGNAQAFTTWLRHATSFYPIDEASVNTLFDSLLQNAQTDSAVALADVLVRIEHSPTASFRLGYAFQMAGQHENAVAAYRLALESDPDLPFLRNNLAMALRLSAPGGQEELALLESSAARNPHEVEAWINLALSYRDRADLKRALGAAAHAVKLAPDSPQALNNQALVLRAAQRWAEAEQFARAACAAAPASPELRFNLACLLLLRGNLDAGWPEYEARWDGSTELTGQRPEFPVPRWRGEPLNGKTLLVWGEQGMGDQLQFCRFIPNLAAHVNAQGGRILWNTFPLMGALLERSLGQHVSQFTSGGSVESLPPFDYEIALNSVPFALGKAIQQLAPDIPYLHADIEKTEFWRARLAKERRVKVGLVWTGSAHHQRNPFRSVGLLRYAAALADVSDVAFYSLQPGASHEVLKASQSGFVITDYTDSLENFDDTAALISALDLVITVCTSVAHLSGSLHQRTWVLLDADPHWCWQTEGTEASWYPGVRLYRQAAFGDWAPVMQALRRDLAAFASERMR
ncbi:MULTISPECIES: tetratricopeptide repeat protein [Burkholderia]|uniref:tetratricopeptide repeat protein n=1 Tax=Burkholderia TaxID=32008 RepID=UPI002164989E|nr:tetratricopeptide repeat protein [Burkholderia glumae]